MFYIIPVTRTKYNIKSLVYQGFLILFPSKFPSLTTYYRNLFIILLNYIMSNCKYLKQKLNRKLYCKKLISDIKISNCSNCIYKEYLYNNKDKNAQHLLKNCEKNTKMHKITHPVVQKSKKLAKLERNRTSILTDDLDHCIICGKSPINKHEIFYGKNRLKSIEYGLVIPLCTKEHHNQIEKKGIHFDSKLCKKWHIKGQKKFNELYPELDFVEIFGRNYL